jgi:hypothetical protein
MARSECICKNFSCEPTLQENIRFRFVKEDNAITDRINLDGVEYKSGLTPNDIANCEIKSRVCFKDKMGFHEPKNDYSDKGGHMERSIANDPRPHGHKEHHKKKHR